MSRLKTEILHLREQGYTYDQIVDELNCSKGTVSYHCGDGQKEKSNNRRRKNRKDQHPFVRKVESFSTVKTPTQRQPTHGTYKLLSLKIETFSKMNKQYTKPSFTVDQALEKFGDNPTCYLTGDPIDINKPRAYAFDHIIPRSRGGSNDIDNLGLTTKEANQAKADMTPDEFYNLCQKVINNATVH